MREKRTKIAFEKKNEKRTKGGRNQEEEKKRKTLFSLSLPSSHTKREEARLARTGAEREYSAETERS